MSDWTAAQLVVCSILALWGLVLAYRYNRSVVRPARLKAAQYKLFALRDKAVRMAIEEPELTKDPVWQGLYGLLNEVAKERAVDQLMRTSIPKFVASMQNCGVSIKLEMHPPEGGKPIKPEELPAMEGLMLRSFIAILETCYRMTRWLRVKYWFASRIRHLAETFERQAGMYASWQRGLSTVAPYAAHSEFVSGDFGEVVEREATRLGKHAPCSAV
jgi:hypothetical protein